MKLSKLFFIAIVLGIVSFTIMQTKPVFYIIGDSTVRNGDGSGRNGQWGWGSFIAEHFDSSKISVQNHAIGGRSSRTFITEGRWEKITANLKKGDYVIMQFGHNDASPLDDTARARGTIRGIGNDSSAIYNPIRKINETVYSYGWYMRKYVRETKLKGAVPIVCSLIPRDNWKEGKVNRSTDNYALWAEQIAKEEGAYFVDLNKLIADKYDGMGQEEVKKLFHGDHTHTSMEGAKLNTEIVVQQLLLQNPGELARYMIKK
ncbi:rhamnogalacturonan acetylesterase [Lacibacter sp. H407]|uniref:rhamnogalacturonan acetylesterase n=1 Tax=Lacibacter sp. H407 TaxID=3133423 RepID=UPI0030C2822F